MKRLIPTTGGFRKGQAGRALGNSNFLLQEPGQRAVLLSDVLSMAILRGWVESHSSLREEVERHLSDKELGSGALDYSEKLFPKFWPEEQWQGECDAFHEARQGFERDDVALMLCCVSGSFPLKPAREGEGAAARAALSDALVSLRELPATAP